MKRLLKQKRTILCCLLLFVLVLSLLLTFLPPFDQQAYLAWVDSWERPGPTTSMAPPEGWPQSQEEHLAILNSVCSDRERWRDSTELVFTAGSQTVMKNGNPCSIRYPVQMEEGVLLVPAEETLGLLGGAIRIHRETGAIRLYLRRYNGLEYYLNEPLDRMMPVLWLDRQAVSFRGENGPVHTPEEVPELGGSSPRWIQGAVYVPVPYLCYALSLQGESLKEGTAYRIAITGEEEDLGGMMLGGDFQTLPISLARELRLVRGDVFNPGTGRFHNAYENNDIHIECMKEFWPLTPEPVSEKRIVGFTLLSPRFATSHGIRVGDTEEKVWERYPTAILAENGQIQIDQYDNKLYIWIKNGVVTSIEGRTPYS